MAPARPSSNRSATAEKTWQPMARAPESLRSRSLHRLHLVPYWSGAVDAAVNYSLTALKRLPTDFSTKPIVCRNSSGPNPRRPSSRRSPRMPTMPLFPAPFLLPRDGRQLIYYVMEAFDLPGRPTWRARSVPYWGRVHGEPATPTLISPSPRRSCAGPEWHLLAAVSGPRWRCWCSECCNLNSDRCATCAAVPRGACVTARLHHRGGW